MKIKISFLVIVFAFSFFNAAAQNVGIGTTTPHASAKLDITATNAGLLIPRLTTAQRTGIASSATVIQQMDIKHLLPIQMDIITRLMVTRHFLLTHQGTIT